MNSIPHVPPSGITDHTGQFDRAELETSLVDRFEKQVDLYPDYPAVKQWEILYTYLQINHRANQVANIISNQLGDYRGPVAFLVDHGSPQVVTIFGILKSGNAYMALDPDFPVERLEFMLSDSETPLIITNTSNLAFAQDLSDGKRKIINLDEIDPETPKDNLNLEIPVDAMALIQYTSGSTGQPKGCILTHELIMHMAYTQLHFRGMSYEDRYIFLVSGSFTAHLGPVFHTLLNGACLFPYDIKKQGLAGLADFLVDEKITIISTIPSTFRYFTSLLDDETTFPDVRILILGADTCLKVDVEAYKKFFPPSCKMYNSLGGTEFLSGGSFVITKGTEIKGGIVPVGYEQEDKKVLIMNEDGDELPAGEVGEIVIQSSYLSPGYWKRPDLTKEKFHPVPGEDGVFQYQTGDLGRKDPDGCLYHLGRKDDQVKIRGNRVELGEINSKLLDSSSIKDAFVYAYTDSVGESHLTAYLVPIEKSETLVEEIIKELQQGLPSYMIPTEFMVLEGIPRLPSGKVDRQALPQPEKSRSSLSSEYVAPQNPVERELVEIWEHLLEFQPVGIQDDFFDLGGHSLMAMRLVVEIEQKLEKTLPFPALIQARTIDGIAKLLMDKDALQAWSHLVALQPLGSKPPFFCVPPSAVTVMVFKDLAKHLSKDRPFYGFEYLGMDGKAEPHDSIVDMAKYYIERVRSLQPEGPYFLGGMCFGGLVAFEMAQQFVAQGEQVPFLGILDSTHAPYLSRPRTYPVFMVTRFINKKILRQKFPIGMASLKEMMKAFSPDDKLGKRIYEVFATHNYARVNYLARPYPGKITLFNTAGSRGEFSRGQWRGVTTEDLGVVSIPGIHRGHREGPEGGVHSFILEPYVQVLAQKLDEHLDQAGLQAA